MRREAYPTDLTDLEWTTLQPLIPPKTGGRPHDVDMRAIVNGALYVHRRGCSWRSLPNDLPPWQTVYTYVRRWKQDGTWEHMLALLGEADQRGDDHAAAG